ncbi:hypothetical protein HAX54_036659 [Datura stramonium]|uniref:RING-type domain-containing protein n=1 Tax=Datura stramonium TaxID=4076 RepID=A0ABS8VH65_DATST|nr:hypothetical protein [Datura stramonium]
MEGQVVHGDGLLVNIANEVKLEEDEEDFCSCCEDEEELEDREETTSDEEEDEVTEDNNEKESARESCEVDLDEHSIKLFFKDYLALMDGLLEAVKSKMRKVYAFTDSEILYQQRILDHANDLEAFVLKLVPNTGLAKALDLAKVAIGVVSSHVEGDESTENCPICCEDRLLMMMTTLKCTHKFCSHCMKTYVAEKSNLVKSPLVKALEEANALNSGQAFTARIQIEVHVCGLVPWHSSMTCEDYQNLPLEERDAGDITLHRLAQNKRWRRCSQCRRMIELTHGCYHMTCWDGQQTCQCAFWDEDYTQDLATQPTQQFEQWAWDSFESLPMMMDAYSDEERSQLALIQRFLAGGFSLTDHRAYQSPPLPGQTLMSMP